MVRDSRIKRAALLASIVMASPAGVAHAQSADDPQSMGQVGAIRGARSEGAAASPTKRIQSRLNTRISSRITQRLDRSYGAPRSATSAIEQASQRSTDTTFPRR